MKHRTMADELAANVISAKEKRSMRRSKERQGKSVPVPETVRLAPTPHGARMVGYVDDDATFPVPMSEEP